MKTSSAKNKGRKLQQWVVEQVRNIFHLTENDVFSRSMGATGADVFLSEKGYVKFPYDVECKNTERLNVWSAWDQAVANTSKSRRPLLVIKKNRRKPLVVMDAEEFFELQYLLERMRKKIGSDWEKAVGLFWDEEVGLVKDSDSN